MKLVLVVMFLILGNHSLWAFENESPDWAPCASCAATDKNHPCSECVIVPKARKDMGQEKFDRLFKTRRCIYAQFTEDFQAEPSEKVKANTCMKLPEALYNDFKKKEKFRHLELTTPQNCKVIYHENGCDENISESVRPECENGISAGDITSVNLSWKPGVASSHPPINLF